MMESDRNLESGLVQALLQIDAHKQSLLQIVARMREQAVANERRQKKYVELLLEHEEREQRPALADGQGHSQDRPSRGNQGAGEPAANNGNSSSEPLELGMLFAPLPQQQPPVQAQERYPAERSSSFFMPQA